MLTPDPNAQMLDDMAQCAYRLGKVFGAEAERAETHERRMEQFELFDRCFFAIRVAIGLQLRLRREARAEQNAERDTERERIEAPDHRDPSDRDPPETDRERLDAESDRDRERERASFPILLRTLEGVAADAAALPGPPPAALPTLRELLVQVRSQPPAAPPSPNTGTPLKSRLAGSATTQVLARPPPSPTPRLRVGLPPRRATGPPRR